MRGKYKWLLGTAVAIAGAICLLLLTIRPKPDPVTSFVEFENAVRSNINAAVRADFLERDATHWYLKSGLEGTRVVTIDRVSRNEVHKTNSLEYPIQGTIEVVFSSSVPVNGLRRYHMKTFERDRGTEHAICIATIVCGFDGYRWNIIRTEQRLDVSLRWDLGAQRQDSRGNLAEVFELKEWESSLKQQLENN